MRATLDIDDDVLRAVAEQARREKRTAGAVISELVRNALVASPNAVRDQSGTHGVRPFPVRGNVVTNAQIDKLREDDAF